MVAGLELPGFNLLRNLFQYSAASVSGSSVTKASSSRLVNRTMIEHEMRAEFSEEQKRKIQLLNLPIQLQQEMIINQNAKLLELLDSGQFSDIVIHVGDEIFTAHRCILADFDEYLFWAGITLDTAVPKQEITIEQGTAKQHRAILRLIYGGEKLSSADEEREDHDFKSVYLKLYFIDKAKIPRNPLEKPPFSDFRIVVEDDDSAYMGSFVHKTILAASSPYFAGLLNNSDLIEVQTGRLSVPEEQDFGALEQSTVNLLTEALYSNNINFKEINSWQKIAALLCLAHQWDCQKVAILCSLELASNRITKENVSTLLKIASIYEMSHLYQSCISFAFNQAKDWENLPLAEKFKQSVLPDGILQGWSIVDIYHAAKKNGNKPVELACGNWLRFRPIKELTEYLDKDSVNKMLRLARELGAEELEGACLRFIEAAFQQ